MKHAVDRRKLGRKTTHRLAMLSNMAISLIEHERIETTVARAKEIRRVVERYVSKGKKDSVHARRLVFGKLGCRKTVTKLFTDLGPRFKDRNGGYTRIMKKSTRRTGDAAEMAIIEFVDYKLKDKASKDKKAETKAEAKEAAKKQKAKAPAQSSAKPAGTAAAGQKGGAAKTVRKSAPRSK